jgi:hypothetical protein
MELKVRTHNVSETDQALKELFDKHDIAAEIRKIDREDEENPIGTILYYTSAQISN